MFVSDVLHAAALAHRTTLNAVRAPGRSRDEVRARWVFFHICRERGLSYPKIAAVCHRHHTSVMHGCVIGPVKHGAFDAYVDLTRKIMKERFPNENQTICLEGRSQGHEGQGAARSPAADGGSLPLILRRAAGSDLRDCPRRDRAPTGEGQENLLAPQGTRP